MANESIKRIKAEIMELENRLHELMAANSAYFIMVTDYGSPDYYDTVYEGLGRITEEEASKIVSLRDIDPDCYNPYYVEVTKEQYDLYREWLALDIVRKGLRRLELHKKLTESLKETKTEVEDRISVVKKALKAPSFARVGEEKYIEMWEVK